MPPAACRETPPKHYNKEVFNMEQRTEQVPIHLKAALTIREAAEYSNIGINKIDQLLRDPCCPFVLYIGAKLKRGPIERLRSKISMGRGAIAKRCEKRAARRTLS